MAYRSTAPLTDECKSYISAIQHAVAFPNGIAMVMFEYSGVLIRKEQIKAVLFGCPLTRYSVNGGDRGEYGHVSFVHANDCYKMFTERNKNATYISVENESGDSCRGTGTIQVRIQVYVQSSDAISVLSGRRIDIHLVADLDRIAAGNNLLADLFTEYGRRRLIENYTLFPSNPREEKVLSDDILPMLRRSAESIWERLPNSYRQIAVPIHIV